MSGTNGQGQNPAQEERSRLLATIASQQNVIQAQGAQIGRLTAFAKAEYQARQRQDAQIAYIARLAGVGKHVASIGKTADAENPAQPVPNPPSEPAFETTEQAVTPETNDDVRNPGMTPGSVQDLAADTTDVALAPGASLPTAPFNDLQNVQAPVAGTETQLPLDQTRIETDVRVGDPMNPQGAFPWNANMGPNNSNQVAASKQAPAAKPEQGNRTLAAIHLARLRLQAGIAEGETNDLVLGDKIAKSTATDQQIAEEISTLSKTQKAASAAQARPGGLVPRSASAGVQRTVPSLAGGSPLSTTAGTSLVDNDTADSDLFL
jgi:hypothetical protein